MTCTHTRRTYYWQTQPLQLHTGVPRNFLGICIHTYTHPTSLLGLAKKIRNLALLQTSTHTPPLCQISTRTPLFLLKRTYATVMLPLSSTLWSTMSYIRIPKFHKIHSSTTIIRPLRIERFPQNTLTRYHHSKFHTPPSFEYATFFFVYTRTLPLCYCYDILVVIIPHNTLIHHHEMTISNARNSTKYIHTPRVCAYVYVYVSVCECMCHMTHSYVWHARISTKYTHTPPLFEIPRQAWYTTIFWQLWISNWYNGGVCVYENGSICVCVLPYVQSCHDGRRITHTYK